MEDLDYEWMWRSRSKRPTQDDLRKMYVRLQGLVGTGVRERKILKERRIVS